MTESTSTKFSSLKGSNLILISLSVMNLISLVILFYFRNISLITTDQQSFTYLVVLVFSGLIASVVYVPREVLGNPKKAIFAVFLPLVLVALSIIVWNVFSEQIYSGLIVGFYGLTVIFAFYAFKMKKSKKSLISPLID